MNDSESMCFFKDVAHLRRNLHGTCRSKTTFTRKRLRKRFAFDKLHDDKVTTVRKISRVENHRGVRVTEFCHCSCFTQKALSNILIASKLAFDDFDCYGALEPEMGGEINR